MKNLQEFNEELQDAYSTSYYRDGNWIPCIKMLRRRGFDDRQVEAIIRSKWTRWAADSSENRCGLINSADLSRFLDSVFDLDAQVKELVVGTFGNL